MASLDDLSNFIANDDYKGFLRTYFLIIDGGQNLSLPSSLELAGIQEGWSEILPEIAGGYTDEFISGLSQYWAQIVKKQGGTIDDNFSKQILALIDGLPMPKGSSEEAGTSSAGAASSAKQGGANEAPTERESSGQSTSSDPIDQANPTVESQISQSYYHFQAASEFKMPDDKKLQSLLKTAVQSEEALPLLVYHVASALKNGKPNFPMSSVISTIQVKWEEILMESYGVQPEMPFVKAIAAQWFSAVNLKGLPASREKTNDLLNHFVQILQKEESGKAKPSVSMPKPAAKTPAIFSKFKSIFKK